MSDADDSHKNCTDLMREKKFRIMLFKTASAAMKAEKELRSRSVPHKLIPVPKKISPDCGICLRFLHADEDDVISTLESIVEFTQISDI